MVRYLKGLDVAEIIDIVGRLKEQEESPESVPEEEKINLQSKPTDVLVGELMHHLYEGKAVHLPEASPTDVIDELMSRYVALQMLLASAQDKYGVRDKIDLIKVLSSFINESDEE